MVREIIKIDEDLCNGCGECVPGCPEGALQIIDEKARLVGDILCDGLGACIGNCPTGALTVETREAEPYDEKKVMASMIELGTNTIVAHLSHLHDHNETDNISVALSVIDATDFEGKAEVLSRWDEVAATPAGHGHGSHAHGGHAHAHGDHNHGGGHESGGHSRPDAETLTIQPMQAPHGGGCPGSASRSFGPAERETAAANTVQEAVGAGSGAQPSALTHWPVQMHLINPAAPHFAGSDFVLAADCTAFSFGAFHKDFLAGKTLGIACPKLDDGQESYVDKLTALIDQAQINTMTVVIMQVPCCGGLLQVAMAAASQANRKVPIKRIIVGVQGEILDEDWV